MKKIILIALFFIAINSLLWVAFIHPRKSQGNSQSETACQIKDIVYENHTFTPDKTYAKKCDIIRFLNKGKTLTWPALGTHDERIQYKGFLERSLATGEINSFKVNSYGIFHFHNHLYDGASGEIIVKE